MQVGVALLAALFVFAGSGGASATPPPDGPRAPEHQATFTVHIENHDDTAHTVSLVVSHQSSPICRDEWPVCPAGPTISEMIVVEKYEIAPGEQISVSDIRFSVPLTAFYTDSYIVTVRTDDGDSVSVTGIATTDTFWENKNYKKYDFFVSNGETVEFNGQIGIDGRMTLTVEPQPMLHER